MMRHLPIRRPGTLLLAVSLSLFAFAGVVDAHAELEDATPNRNAEVEGSPPVISGIYSEAMEPDGSSLTLLDADGTELATGGVDPEDDRRMVIDPVPELVPGTYTVESTTKSAADGDVDRTKWSFTVLAPPTPEPTPEPTAPPTASPTAAPTPPPATASATTAPTPSASASAVPSATASASASASATPSVSPAPSADGSDTPTSGGTDVLLPILAAVIILVVIGGVLYSRRDRSTPTQP